MIQDDLLDIADHLARLEPGRPRRTSLRRAVSSAYYAIFHATAALCADQLVGWSQPWEAFTPIYRTLDHGRSKKVFEEIKKTQKDDLAIIAQTFILLQERRHTADYDPEPFPFGRSETLDLIDQARQAILWLNALTVRDKLLLATRLIARTRPGS